nr:hypothetical protein BJQ95_02273 [Cryobacterium sp. SO1]
MPGIIRESAVATENFATPDLADAANDALIKPRAAANRFIIQPAIDRGEVAPGCDIDTLCLLPALSLRAGDNPAAR